MCSKRHRFLDLQFLFQCPLQEEGNSDNLPLPEPPLPSTQGWSAPFYSLPAPCAAHRGHHHYDSLNKASFLQGNVLHRRRLRDFILLLLPEVHAVLVEVRAIHSIHLPLCDLGRHSLSPHSPNLGNDEHTADNDGRGEENCREDEKCFLVEPSGFPFLFVQFQSLRCKFEYYTFKHLRMRRNGPLQ